MSDMEKLAQELEALHAQVDKPRPLHEAARILRSLAEAEKAAGVTVEWIETKKAAAKAAIALTYGEVAKLCNAALHKWR